jgi:FKBP-type peptidyl-prolyl cis-trans isomerase FklB
MKPALLSAVLGLTLLAVLYAAEEENKEAAPKLELKTLKDKASYAIGQNIGRSFKAQKLDLDLKLLVKGMEDVTTGAKPLLTPAEVQETMMAFQQEMMTKQTPGKKADAEKNKKDGETFLAANKAKPGVVTLPSGLQYKILTEGKGDKPKATDTVKTHYRGTLIDGTEFDSSYSRNEPTEFPVGGVIKGWTEALQLMPVGSKWQLFIPSDIAYGPNGAGEDIGPNATLIFEIELLEIVK